MDVFLASRGNGSDDGDCDSGGKYVPEPGSKDIQVQLVISLALGITAFLGFCFLRPRWKTLYAARRRHYNLDIIPDLSDSFFGWMPALYKITEEQVLSSAGLDAYVFLSFFKMSLRLFAIMAFFAAAVLEPINRYYDPEYAKQHDDGDKAFLHGLLTVYKESDLPIHYDRGKTYLWSYVVFVYFFGLMTLWFLNKETFKVIKVRQRYLGRQSTITDRTFRITGIPKELRSEEKIKIHVEKLEIGMVESVTLCRDWKEIDNLVAERASALSKLEEIWSVYLAQKAVAASPAAPTRNGNTAANDDDEEAAESSRLLPGEVGAHQFAERPRPVARIWYGFFKLQSRKTDAIDYYEEKLRQLDEKIRVARQKEYEPVDIAFVTMDSIAACQMANQALLDPRPGRLLSKRAPAPADIIWENTYSPRWNRRMRSWTITVFVAVLSIVWLAPVASLASLLNLCTIKKWAPNLAESLARHDITRALVQTGLPTIVVSLLNVAVPYLYDYLSNYQGMLSQGDVELSIISKNFFFAFFNIFLAFTVFTSAAKFLTIVQESLKDTTKIAYILGREVRKLNISYMSFIMLQGVGLFPFRLLEFGSVVLYPIYRMGAKTPRDFAEIMKPPIFSYGFYLPTAILIFILCLCYSVFPGGFLMLGLGYIYFALGYITYKYQLLYAMDQPQHATGGAWRIIAYRVLLGLVVFELTMAGFLAPKDYWMPLLIIPLLLFTLWYMWYFRRRFVPLTRYIALSSIKRASSGAHEDDDGDAAEDGPLVSFSGDNPRQRLARRMSTVDEDREKGQRFVNPSLIVRLEQPWIYQDPPPLIPTPAEDDLEQGRRGLVEEPGSLPGENPNQEVMSDPRSTSSSFSLGDTHIWRDTGNDGEPQG